MRISPWRVSYETETGEKRALYGVLLEGERHIVDAAAGNPGRM